jgi:DNA-binding transcriptional LysR family regulator
MNLNHLRLFVQVADASSFTGAAEHLGLQRSSVSRGVAALERDLGVQLFHRTTRTVALTSAGEALYGKVAGQLGALVSALEDLPERDTMPSGQLRITVPHDLGADIFPRIMSGFVRRYPGVRVDAHVTNRVVDLVAEGFDAALRPGTKTLPDSSLRVLRLGATSSGVYASPTYLARAGTPRDAAELAAHDWVAGPVADRLPITPQRPPALRANDMFFVRTALLEHMGVSVLPDFIARKDVVEGKLVRLQLPELDQRFYFYLLTPPAEHVPRKVEALRDYLVEYLEAHPVGGLDA